MTRVYIPVEIEFRASPGPAAGPDSEWGHGHEKEAAIAREGLRRQQRLGGALRWFFGCWDAAAQFHYVGGIIAFVFSSMSTDISSPCWISSWTTLSSTSQSFVYIDPKTGAYMELKRSTRRNCVWSTTSRYPEPHQRSSRWDQRFLSHHG